MGLTLKRVLLHYFARWPSPIEFISIENSMPFDSNSNRT